MPENTYGARSIASSPDVTPSSVAVLSGLGGSGGNSCWSGLLGSFLGLGTLFLVKLFGVHPMWPAPMWASLPVFLCHLNELFVRRWGLWIWLIDPPSTFITALCFLGTCSDACPGFRIASSPCYRLRFAVIRLIRIGSPLGFLPGEPDSPPLIDPTVGSPLVSCDPLRNLRLVDCLVSFVHLLLIDPTEGSLLYSSFTGFVHEI